MLPHIMWNTPNIIEDTAPVRHILGGMFVHHSVHQSSPVDV